MFEEIGYSSLGSQELRDYMAGEAESEYALVDVRQPQEYLAGHIPGARNMPLPEFGARLGELDPNARTVLYCQSGGRSRVAATMAVESEHFAAGLLNLDQGMNGWDGVAVDQAPRLQVFHGMTDPRQVLLKALELEKAALLLYNYVAKKADKEPVVKLMQDLAGMETAHAKLVYKELAKLGGQELAPFDDLFASLTGDVLEGGRTIAELKPWVQEALQGGGMEAAELALEIEYTAYDLYRAMAHENSDKASGEVFLTLAGQEKNHGRMILDRLDDLMEPTE
ncbi:MAG: sulfurtransferase [Desulfovibrio sp.]|nr:MAG: sulfurtransferase [Desulfovibrio sp.]